jgi:transcriptional regulator with XRE-family HTH domain
MGTRHTIEMIGERLRAARVLRGLTQVALASRTGRTENFILRLEGGDRVPSVRLLCRLCEELGCSADYLLGATPPIQVPGPRREAS